MNLSLLQYTVDDDECADQAGTVVLRPIVPSFDYASLDAETRIEVQRRTGEIKSLMRRSAQDIIDIGRKLIEVKARLGHGHFGTWLEGEFRWTDKTARRFMKVAESFKTDNLSDLSIAPSALYDLAAPSTPEPARMEAIERAEAGESITRAVAKEIISTHKTPVVDDLALQPHPARPAALTTPKPSPMAVHFSSETPEHYTPREVLDAVIACMGGIDLDPCSNSHTAPSVPAAKHYTLADNGLAQDWRGRVYMNPPYGSEIIDWVRKLVESHQSGAVTEAIALVPSRTDTQWWQLLSDYPVCFVEGRLKFGEAKSSAPFPSAVFYLPNGTAIDRFYDTFSAFGNIWQRTPDEMVAR